MLLESMSTVYVTAVTLLHVDECVMFLGAKGDRIESPKRVFDLTESCFVSGEVKLKGV
jgi:hypothetical protein